MKTSENINEIAKAMSLAQSQMTAASTDSTNPHFRSKYANLESVIDAFRGPLCANGLTFWQDVCTQTDIVAITTRIAHSSGQWVEFGPLCIPVGKKDAHGIGSATTYGKRYALCAAMGVAPGEIDDDGNAAVASVPSQLAANKVESVRKETKKETSPEATVTKEQAQELFILSATCDPEYMEKVFARMHQKGFKAFDQIPKSLFEQIKIGMINNANEYTRKKENV